MKWINFLHCYQPVNSDAHIIKEATEKSYMRVVRALEEDNNIKFNININGCLILRWEELGYLDLIKRIGRLIKNKKIELTSTACYHPLLPLIKKEEIERQINENENILKKYFGSNFKPKGFFMPEMAYSTEAAKIVKEKGYDWIILDEIAYNGKLENVDFNKVYKDKNSGLDVVFRSRKASSGYAPEYIKKNLDNKDLIITATDGELYGLRHIDHTAEFEKLLKEKGLETILISDYVSKFKNKEEVEIVPCSWDSTEEDLKEKKPYILWDNKDKTIQQTLWKLANLAYNTTERYKNDENYVWARWHLVRGLASCTFWWASERDFSHIYGPYAWNPDEIERGTNELIRSIRTLEDVTTRETKMKAEKIYIEIKRRVWEKHWTYYWKRKKIKIRK